jgi:hypothetical protein
MNDPATPIQPCATMSDLAKAWRRFVQSLKVRIGTSRRAPMLIPLAIGATT